VLLHLVLVGLVGLLEVGGGALLLGVEVGCVGLVKLSDLLVALGQLSVVLGVQFADESLVTVVLRLEILLVSSVHIVELSVQGGKFSSVLLLALLEGFTVLALHLLLSSAVLSLHSLEFGAVLLLERFK
jgi:hypothetical protein